MSGFGKGHSAAVGMDHTASDNKPATSLAQQAAKTNGKRYVNDQATKKKRTTDALPESKTGAAAPNSNSNSNSNNEASTSHNESPARQIGIAGWRRIIILCSSQTSHYMNARGRSTKEDGCPMQT